MKKINVMVNGLPGNMAAGVAEHVLSDERFELVPYSLTGPEIDLATCRVNNIGVALIQAHERDKFVKQIATEIHKNK